MLGGGIVTWKSLPTVVVLVLGVLSAGSVTETQPAPKTARAGYLGFGSAAPGTPHSDLSPTRSGVDSSLARRALGQTSRAGHTL
jgi:hypothetical protein